MCPLEYRYGSKELKALFGEEKRLELQLKVESTLAWVLAELGRIPEGSARVIERAANTGRVKLERVKRLEERTHHDIMALVRALAEQCGDAGGHVHLGATSNDIIDTAQALVLREALDDHVLPALSDLRGVLARLAIKHKRTLMLGRTHGQAALPITLGLKLIGYAFEVDRHIRRVRQMRPRLAVGKMSGAVGTGAGFGSDAHRLQRMVMDRLGLGVEDSPSQVVARDRYAELLCVLAQISASCEKFATEVRNLQRTEIGELAEGFEGSTQVGSSTMAHKQNPILAENICSLARVVRGFVVPGLENVPLWHERDLTNSASERFVIPHAVLLTDDIIRKSARLFSKLRVDCRRMRDNLEAAGDVIMAEPVMLRLVELGMGRQDAHELLRRASLAAVRSRRPLLDVLSKEPKARRLLTVRLLRELMEPRNYIGDSVAIVERGFGKLMRGPPSQPQKGLS